MLQGQERKSGYSRKDKKETKNEERSSKRVIVLAHGDSCHCLLKYFLNDVFPHCNLTDPRRTVPVPASQINDTCVVIKLCVTK